MDEMIDEEENHIQEKNLEKEHHIREENLEREETLHQEKISEKERTLALKKTSEPKKAFEIIHRERDANN